jgi:glycosyltransferase involved in cell wall biosynthesis
MPTQTLVRYNPSFLTLLSSTKQPTHHPIQGKVQKKQLSEVLFITTYPPRECGIATYTQDLIRSICKGFGSSFNISICALATDHEEHEYSDTIKFILNTDDDESYAQLAHDINYDNNISLVVLQHEFGLFDLQGAALTSMLHKLNKPVSIVFHTVLPGPDTEFKKRVQSLAATAESLIVMTQSSSNILVKDYIIKKSKINVIHHGTHLIKHGDRENLKAKYGLIGKNVLSTFGFLGTGKSIETTLNAMPAIINHDPDTIFLIIGKTHPSTIKREGEFYRDFLKAKVEKLGIQQHVLFVNAFLPLNELLEYLQLTDIYLFTSKDPNQAVSGTFSYAISCGCPIISTPIPHAREVLKNDAGIIIDFNSTDQLSKAVIRLLKDEEFRNELSLNGLHRMASTAWENSAIAHANLIKKTANKDIKLNYNLPEINLSHIKKLTTDIGMIQFSRINVPDISTGYTLDDNARALVAACQHYALTLDEDNLRLIRIYFTFIKRCIQKDGNFLNYLDKNLNFTSQNTETNLEDSNGRAIWALGFLIDKGVIIPFDIIYEANHILTKALKNVKNIHSTRAMAFIIKGLYFANRANANADYIELIHLLAERLVRMYEHESDEQWLWYESYLTYGNSIIPEAMLCAYNTTGNPMYKKVAKNTFDFLLSITFNGDRMKVISNQTWMHKGNQQIPAVSGGEQPIDVAYTILALKKFGDIFENSGYMEKMRHAFNWFLGENHLHQIIYNPCTGGCYDGLEEHNVNLNQGAESTVSYLMARLTLEGE